ncbi:MAG: DUF4145 domain-containing protein [Candidatus Lokiarchaeota archaeon]|nr:DUF4145 domain-containing protein [Candidatus Lokiarchaeota archaeon]
MSIDLESLPARKRIYCNRCKSDTNHELKSEHHRDSYYDEANFQEIIGFRFFICAGCETGVLEEYYTNTGYKDDNEKQLFDYEYHPIRSEFHVERKIFIKLPKKLNTIYREILNAFNSEANVLCAIGIRALLEGICADKKITGTNLSEKIDNLDNILPQNIVDNLHSIRFIGNSAAHELSSPKRIDLRLAIDILQDILNYLYELDYKTSRLNKSYKTIESGS